MVTAKPLGQLSAKPLFLLLYIYIYIYIFKILRKASVCAKTQTYGTDSPSRSKSRTLSITPLYHSQKKMAQWRTSSTHDSIQTGVFGRCCHVHLKHQIHGANGKTPFFSPKGNQYWLRHLIQGVNWTILYKNRKKGVSKNSKSLERQVYVLRLTLQYIYIYKLAEWFSSYHLWQSCG